MASSNSSSPSSSHSSSDESAERHSTTPNGGRDSQQRNIHHSSPYTLRPRAVSAAASDKGWPEEDEDRRRHEPAETVEIDDEQQWPVRGDDIEYGRREIESDSSDYQPSDSASSPEPSLPEIIEEEAESVKAGDGKDDGSNSSESDSGSDSEGDGSTTVHRPNRKRPRQRTLCAASVSVAPELKKRRRAKKSVNAHYLELLNDDMDDARRRYVPDSWPELERIQAGMTVWTAEEKEMFYESVSRLGSDDIPGIAARLLGSKSEIEVRHYLHVLQKDVERRQFELRAPLHRPLLSDFPAATEISEACCSALEKTADAIAQREAHREAQEEERKWGPHWLLTGDNCHDLSKAALEMTGMPADDEASNLSPMPNGGPRGERLVEMGAQLRPEAVPPLALFSVRTMLLLSERVFMNGVAKDANYMGLGDALPAVRMSALHDLYEVVYALTQRLATTAMHICRSRDQSKRLLPHSVKKLVRPRDVRAAVASLGLKRDDQAFWARCPRRLGLNVSRSAVPFADMDGASRYEVVGDDAKEEDNSEDEDNDSDSDDDIMPYDEVEKELLPEQLVERVHEDAVAIDGKLHSSSSDEDDSDKETGTDSDENDKDDDKDERGDTAVTNQCIKDEADEIIHYTANGYPHAAWAHTSLKNRIRDELKEEAYACAVDEHSSRHDEMYLWTVLGQQPTPPELDQFDENATPHVEGFSAEARRFPVDEVIETGSNWRGKLQYEAEWEHVAAKAQETVRAANERPGRCDEILNPIVIFVYFILSFNTNGIRAFA